jgi:hypothetical protein
VVTWLGAIAAQTWQWLDKRLEPPRLRFISSAILGLSLVLLVISFTGSDRSHTVFGPPLGADFAGFYTAGSILNQSAREDRQRLYDAPFQDRLYHQLLPDLPEEAKLPYVHPPFVAWAFRLLALLRYESAFAIWLAVSAALYLLGLKAIRRSYCAVARLDWTTAFLLALSFEPFIMECWLGGQLSACGFLLFSLTFVLGRAGRPFAGGLALGFCLYKPTLLVLALPMLVLSRRWRMLAGFAITALVLAAISFLGTGEKNCTDFLNALLGFSRTTTGSPQGAAALELRLWKYVDLNSFLRLLFGLAPRLHWFLLGGTAVIAMPFLVRLWWVASPSQSLAKPCVWPVTLTWTLVLNLYVGIYDTVLAALAALITMASIREKRPEAELSGSFRFWLFLLYLTPWVTQPLARTSGLQVYTLVLLGFGIQLLTMASRAACQPAAVPLSSVSAKLP